MTKTKAAPAKSAVIFEGNVGSYFNPTRLKLTVADLERAIAKHTAETPKLKWKYSANQSAFARDVMECDGRIVRRWLAGGRMSESMARKLHEYIATK